MMRGNRALFFALTILLGLPCVFVSGQSHAETALKQDYMIVNSEIINIDRAINEFQIALKTALMAAMSEGGPKSAIKVCNEKAPEIANNISKKTNMTLRRTSLRWRNPDNQPSAQEENILNAFEVRKSAGDSIASLTDTVQTSEGLRYMKAIPMQGMCAACHGKNIEPKLYQTITSIYPDDKAIGFQEGDIRGAFSVLIKAVTTNTSHD